ncbi:hypothetical protein V8G54_006561 [Vigna mungo]|uniref:Uncharacterized protein n=1 Tax=Vigna mungo TaxID=3915 RepID=A0AAQ3S4N6_VIGMU
MVINDTGMEPPLAAVELEKEELASVLASQAVGGGARASAACVGAEYERCVKRRRRGRGSPCLRAAPTRKLTREIFLPEWFDGEVGPSLVVLASNRCCSRRFSPSRGGRRRQGDATPTGEDGVVGDGLRQPREGDVSKQLVMILAAIDDVSIRRKRSPQPTMASAANNVGGGAVDHSSQWWISVVVTVACGRDRDKPPWLEGDPSEMDEPSSKLEEKEALGLAGGLVPLLATSTATHTPLFGGLGPAPTKWHPQIALSHALSIWAVAHSAAANKKNEVLDLGRASFFATLVLSFALPYSYWAYWTGANTFPTRNRLPKPESGFHRPIKYGGDSKLFFKIVFLFGLSSCRDSGCDISQRISLLNGSFTGQQVTVGSLIRPSPYGAGRITVQFYPAGRTVGRHYPCSIRPVGIPS